MPTSGLRVDDLPGKPESEHNSCIMRRHGITADVFVQAAWPVFMLCKWSVNQVTFATYVVVYSYQDSLATVYLQDNTRSP